MNIRLDSSGYIFMDELRNVARGITSTSVLFGRNQHRTRQFLSLAAAIFLASTVFYGGAAIDAIPFIWQLAYVPVVIGVGGALVNAYLNDGLLVSVLCTVGVALAVVFTHGINVIADSSASFPSEAYYLSITVILLGIGVGVFVVGAGTRRVVTHIGCESEVTADVAR